MHCFWLTFHPLSQLFAEIMQNNVKYILKEAICVLGFFGLYEMSMQTLVNIKQVVFSGMGDFNFHC